MNEVWVRSRIVSNDLEGQGDECNIINVLSLQRLLWNRSMTDNFLLQSLNWLTVLPGDRPICSHAKCPVTTPALVLSPTSSPETVGIGKRGVNRRWYSHHTTDVTGIRRLVLKNAKDMKWNYQIYYSTKNFYSLMLAAWKHSGGPWSLTAISTKSYQAIEPTNLNVFRDGFCNVEEK
jgi:hypothetical protein